MLDKNFRLSTIFALFIGMLIAMNVLGGKIIEFGPSFSWGFISGPFSTSVAFLIVPLSFLLTDIVEEVYGRRLAKQFVLSGLITLAVFLGILLLFVALPPAARYTNNDAYTSIFGTSARIVFASIVAFLLSQFHDVWSFNLWKEKTHGKMLWLRTNISTALSMVVDTFVFMFLAFYMVTPAFDAAFVISLAVPYLIFKMVWGSISSPLVYIGAAWLRGGKSASK